jgi:hypothetical protein
MRALENCGFVILQIEGFPVPHPEDSGASQLLWQQPGYILNNSFRSSWGIVTTYSRRRKHTVKDLSSTAILYGFRRDTT